MLIARPIRAAASKNRDVCPSHDVRHQSIIKSVMPGRRPIRIIGHDSRTRQK